MLSEALSVAGLRPDGRQPRELRHVKCSIGGASVAHDGSAHLEMGLTKVQAVVCGPREVKRRSAEKHDRAVITCECRVAPYAGAERRRRRGNDRRLVELALAVQRVFEAVVVTELYPRTQIDIFIHVLEEDGGQLPACINAACLALVDAGVSVRDLVVACAATLVDGELLVDLNRQEQNAGGPYLPVAITPSDDRVVLAQLDSRVPLDSFDQLMQVAVEGCHAVHATLAAALRQHIEKKHAGSAAIDM